MDQSRGPCRTCGEAVPVTVTICPACGYDSTRANRRRYYLGAIGTVLTLTVLLAPIGLPLIGFAARYRRDAESVVADRPPEPVSQYALSVLRHHTGLASPPSQAAMFTRGDDPRLPVNRPPRL